MNLFFFDTIKAEDFNATEAPIVEDDRKSVSNLTVPNLTNVNKNREDPVTQLSEVPNMSAVPKMPVPPTNRNATRNNVEIDETGTAIDASTQQAQAASSEEGSLLRESHKMLDIPHIPESPNIADRQKTETTAEHYAGSVTREFKNFFEEATSIEEHLPLVRPYIIGGVIALPAFLMLRNIRRQGLANYIHKSPMQGKLIQLLLFSSGIAAGTYFYKKPRKTKYVKDFRDA